MLVHCRLKSCSRNGEASRFSGAGLHAKRSEQPPLAVPGSGNRYHFETTEECMPLFDLYFESITWMSRQLLLARSGRN
jgi:hypothetical protein